MFPSSHIRCTSCPKAPPSGDWTSQIKPICAWWSFEWKCSWAHTLHSHKTFGKRRGLVAMGRSCNSSNYLEIYRLWAWRFRWKEHPNLLWESRFGVELRSPCDEGVSSGESKDLSKWPVSQSQRWECQPRNLQQNSQVSSSFQVFHARPIKKASWEQPGFFSISGFMARPIKRQANNSQVSSPFQVFWVDQS